MPTSVIIGIREIIVGTIIIADMGITIAIECERSISMIAMNYLRMPYGFCHSRDIENEKRGYCKNKCKYPFHILTPSQKIKPHSLRLFHLKKAGLSQ
jgi:hypothetical protein